MNKIREAVKQRQKLRDELGEKISAVRAEYTDRIDILNRIIREGSKNTPRLSIAKQVKQTMAR